MSRTIGVGCSSDPRAKACAPIGVDIAVGLLAARRCRMRRPIL